MARTKIEDRRKKRGLSRAELAQLAGVTENQIYRWEIFDTDIPNKNAREPKWGDFLLLAEALQCSPAALVGDTDAPLIRDEVEEVASPAPLANSLIYTYRVLRTTLADVPTIRVGELVYVNQTPEAIEARASDDVLLVSVALAGPDQTASKMLLQFHAPQMLVTNRPGLNWTLRLDDPAFSITVLGKVMPG